VTIPRDDASVVSIVTWAGTPPARSWAQGREPCGAAF
jgi:hypothetical protein